MCVGDTKNVSVQGDRVSEVDRTHVGPRPLRTGVPHKIRSIKVSARAGRNPQKLRYRGFPAHYLR